jgi:hypothetical protein
MIECRKRPELVALIAKLTTHGAKSASMNVRKIK